ncbi:MAG: tetratricopeptide repeat protein [Capsulimonadales bacterium]|nr:tetratricopeptide repeat protein [Capsulimonadales bacterium]
MIAKSASDDNAASAARPKTARAGVPAGLMPVAESISAWQRVTGPAMAVNWARAPIPPIEPDKAGFYAAALPSAGADVRGKIALCLLWCDMEAGRYCAAYADHYRLAFQSFPDDERAGFYIAALCASGQLDDVTIRRDAYARVLEPERKRSPYWRKFSLKPERLRAELARIYLNESDILTPERVTLVEEALEECAETSPDRMAFARYIAAAYRSTGRQDTTAETVYRFLFVNAPEDEENNAFLARAYHDHVRRDANACAIYARMIAQCEAQGSGEEANRWTVRLAQTFLALNRADDSTLETYRKAYAMHPEDRDLEAGYLASYIRRRNRAHDDETIPFLEKALEREEILMPRFQAHRWNWVQVVRALAVAYATEKRSDEATTDLFDRTTKLCPEDRELWGWYARVLMLRADYSMKAVEVYERAIEGGSPEAGLEAVLAAAYLVNNAYVGTRRVPALRLWEEMFRRGEASPEMIDALAKAYTGEERVNDVALMLWERAVEQNPKDGPMFLRLAQELRARSEFEKSLTYYQSAARLLPKSFLAQYETATLLVQQNADYPTAIRLLRKAIQLPEGIKHLGAHHALGEALLARGNREEAKEVFTRIVQEIDAHHTPTLLSLGSLNLKFEEQGMKEAEALFDKALITDPNNPEAYRRLAELYREKGQFENEQEALEKYLELSPPDGEKYRQLGDLYIRRGDFARAETALRQVISLGKADKQTYILLGEVILQARQRSKAVAVSGSE